jgi:hypothetical protein
MGGFVTLKKNRAPCFFLQKAGCKKPGHCYSREEEAAWPLFLNNNEPVFCTLKSRVPDLFYVPDPKKISGRPDNLEYLSKFS